MIAGYEAAGIKPMLDDEAQQKWLEMHDANAAKIEQYFGTLAASWFPHRVNWAKCLNFSNGWRLCENAC
jgi:hypothetical protein